MMVPVPVFFFPNASSNGTVALTNGPNGRCNNPSAACGTLEHPVQANSAVILSQEGCIDLTVNSEPYNVLRDQQLNQRQLYEHRDVRKTDSQVSDAVEPLVSQNRSQALCRNRSRSKSASRLPGYDKRSPSKGKPGRTQRLQSSSAPSEELNKQLQNRVTKRKQGLANVKNSRFYKEVERTLGEAHLPQEPDEPNLDNVISTSKRMWEAQLHGFRDPIRKAYAVLQLVGEGFEKAKAEATWQKVMDDYEGKKKPSMKSNLDDDGEAEEEAGLWDGVMELVREKLRMQQLEEMGFKNKNQEAIMRRALQRADGDVGLAAEFLSHKTQRRRLTQ